MDALQLMMTAKGDDPLRHAAFDILVGHRDVTSNVSAADADDFILDYFEDGLRGDHSGPRGEGRHVLGHMFISWFDVNWVQDNPNIRRGRDMLARVIGTGDEIAYEVVVLSVLEHLFEDDDISNYFTEWVDDPVLSRAYHEALELSGRSAH